MALNAPDFRQMAITLDKGVVVRLLLQLPRKLLGARLVWLCLRTVSQQSGSE